MSLEAMKAAIECGLPRAEKYVLIMYANYADATGGSVFPATERISWITGYSIKQVQRLTQSLLADGYMEDIGTSKYRTIVYQIHLDRLPELPKYETWKGTAKAKRRGQNVPHVDKMSTDVDKMSPDPLDLNLLYNNGGEPEEESIRISEGWNELLNAVTAVTKRDPLTLVESDRIVIDILLGKIAPAEIEKHFDKGGWWWTSFWKGKKNQRATFKDVGEQYMIAQEDGDTEPAKSKADTEAQKAWREVKAWLAYKKEFKVLGESTKAAVRVVKESTLRGMGKGNEHQLRQQFLNAWKQRT